MPVAKDTKTPKNAKALKEKVDERAKAKEYKAIGPLVQQDVSTWGGSAY
jgi:hypothetical protein